MVTRQQHQLISLIIPCYNEAGNIDASYRQLCLVAGSVPTFEFEFIYVNDGSTDNTAQLLQQLAATDKRVQLICFTRNFGKELATTAGIQQASGAAILMLDADGQHPAELIPDFIAAWQDGAQVVIGVRRNHYPGRFKRLTSKLFYQLFNLVSGTASLQLVPGSTDFRLIDRVVQVEFNRLHEHSRMTRGLIDWLGFTRTYIYFDMSERTIGTANYSLIKLVGLALNSFVSHSLRPLYILATAGAAVLLASVALAVASAGEMLIGDPLNLKITGTAYLVMLVLFLIGIMMISQSILALYISHIHTETKGRPLYIVDTSTSRLHSSRAAAALPFSSTFENLRSMENIKHVGNYR